MHRELKQQSLNGKKKREQERQKVGRRLKFLVGREETQASVLAYL